MSTDPAGPTQPEQLSPDGLWRWDGSRWVPTGAAAPAPAVRRPSRAWMWWLGGGCAVLLIVAIVAGVFGLSSLVSRFQQGGFSCLPSNFPAYPSTSVTNENSYVGSGLPPGDSQRCTMTLQSTADVTTVTDWYASHLSSGDWSDTTDASTGTIRFHSNSRPSTQGSVELLGRGQQTAIVITLYS